MLVTSIQGFTLGLSLILPIGSQNAFILNQGIKKEYHFITATICAICDIILITIGIYGGGTFFSSHPDLLLLITVGGICFLCVYAYASLKSAYKNYQKINCGKEIGDEKATKRQTMLAVVLATLAVSLLNPHAYLDTVVLLGSIGGQIPEAERLAFAIGTFTASIVWFYSLSIASAKLASLLAKPKVKMWIDCFVAGMMLYVARLLLQSL